MTKQEWLIHILNGGKGISNYTDEGEYVHFDGEKFIYSTGYVVDLQEFHVKDFAAYEEPKKMIKIAPYLYEHFKDDCYVQTLTYFKDDMTLLKIYKDKNLKFKRLTALEIEVEDYEQN